MADKMTDAQLVLEYMEEFGSINPLEALRDVGVYRLSGRIYDLRKKGYSIITDKEVIRTRRGKISSVARYRLESDT